MSVPTYSSTERGRTLHAVYLKCVSLRENSSFVKLSFNRPNQVSNVYYNLSKTSRSIIAEESSLLVFPFTAIVVALQAQTPLKVCDLKSAIFVLVDLALANHLSRKRRAFLSCRKMAS